MNVPDDSALLLTAFEPSGDALAARLATIWRQRHPDWRLYGMGGPRMQAAGVELLEETTAHAAMGLDALRLAFRHRQRIKRLGQWMQGRKLKAVIPTDSPAANWAVCALTRRLVPEARIVHLAAPQLWAWAPWRIRKMRRLSDHVLCLLPFEPDWFSQRGMSATFVSHPLFEEHRDEVMVDPALPQAPMRLALLPGSRGKEIDKNGPTLLRVFEALRERHGELIGCVAATNEALADRLRQCGGPWPQGLEVRVGQTPAVIDWAQVALSVSGTATLQILSRRCCMVAMYNLSRISWHLGGRFLVATRTFTLPNLISESMGMGRVIDEFVPHHGQVPPLVQATSRLLEDPQARERQLEQFDQIVAPLEQTPFGPTVCSALEAQLRLTPSVAALQ